MASNAIPFDFVIGDNTFNVTNPTDPITISINNTIFDIQPAVGDQILVAQTFASPYNGLYQVTGIIPGGVTAVRRSGVPYTVGTRFIGPFNQIYVVVSNAGGLILIRPYDPNDPTLALLLRLVYGIGRNLCCDQPQDCGCGCEKKEKKCVVVVKECKKKCKKVCKKECKKEKPCGCQKKPKQDKSCGCGCGGY